MFLVFPGILITIGVGLLIISIIAIIIAYKTEERPDVIDAAKLSKPKQENNIEIPEPIKEKAKDEEQEKETKPIGIMDQISKEAPTKEEKEEPTIDAFEEEFGNYEKKEEPIIIPSIPKNEPKEDEEIEL